jgi:ATPase subunit of ABC transporter with duplicated ATPase domains
MPGIISNFRECKIHPESINISGLTLYITSDSKGNNTLIDDSDFKITKNYKYGLVAPNGSGKTCLFNQLISDPFKISESMTIGYLNQNVQHSTKTLIVEMLETNHIWRKEQELIQNENADALNTFYVEYPKYYHNTIIVISKE